MEIRVGDTYSAFSEEQWNRVVGEASPFLEYAFLAGLEATGCATAATGWIPRPVTVWSEGELVAFAPAWKKLHSQGEFVYDFQWADAAERANYPYYPKLVVAVPFTPVTGSRLVVRPGFDRPTYQQALLQGLQDAASDCHGLHILFNPPQEATERQSAGGFVRTQFQFWWRNEGYQCFNDYLLRFKSKTRNKIRRERRLDSGVQIRSIREPTTADILSLHRFYRATCEQFGPWGRVYMNEDFFVHLSETWGHRLHAVIAAQDGVDIAGAFNVLKGRRLYGRHWGATQQHAFLHFEVCYYQAIEYCVDHGIQTFEPGHGGGHKYKRGFLPHTTTSSHWLRHPSLHQALSNYTAQERVAVEAKLLALRTQSPLR